MHAPRRDISAGLGANLSRRDGDMLVGIKVQPRLSAGPGAEWAWERRGAKVAVERLSPETGVRRDRGFP